MKRPYICELTFRKKNGWSCPRKPKSTPNPCSPEWGIDLESSPLHGVCFILLKAEPSRTDSGQRWRINSAASYRRLLTSSQIYTLSQCPSEESNLEHSRIFETPILREYLNTLSLTTPINLKPTNTTIAGYPDFSLSYLRTSYSLGSSRSNLCNSGIYTKLINHSLSNTSFIDTHVPASPMPQYTKRESRD